MTAPSLFDRDAAPPSEPLRLVPDAAGETADGRPAGTSETRSLYRKYRPQTFDDAELVGQEPIVRTLRNAIRLDRVAHAYLFCGPRGTGKTTTARLLAKAVNCLDPDPDRRPCNACANCRAIASGAATDVIEIDAASNRGIDDIRDLRERVKYAPSQLRVKFYIVDEAHQITGPAANAFLKTLEEPPAHTKFVLATTDPEELLPTIVSRCQRFDFRRIGANAMAARLRTVASAEGLAVADEALGVIARHATGSLRDALGLLDQLALYRERDDDAVEPRPITAADVRAVLGVSRNDRVEALVGALADRDAAAALGAVNAAVEAGEDVRQLNRQLVAYLRLLLHERAGGSPDADAAARELATRFDLAELADLARRFGEIDYKIKHSPYGQLPLEVALIEGVLRGTQGARPAVAAVPPPKPTSDVATPTTPADNGLPIPDAEDGARAVLSRPPTTALRDRVRGAVPAAPPLDRPSPSPMPGSASRSSAPATVGNAAIVQNSAVPAAAAAATVSVEQLADLWPRIRQDVKAVNRRIEALLSSVDPAAVAGDRITLAAAYEFHRDKLNTDEVRAVVEEIVGRLVGRSVRIDCQLREEAVRLTTAAPTVPAPAPPSPSPPHPVAPDSGSEDDSDERRLRAAKNIFDAEEIDLPPSAS